MVTNLNSCCFILSREQNKLELRLSVSMILYNEADDFQHLYRVSGSYLAYL